MPSSEAYNDRNAAIMMPVLPRDELPICEDATNITAKDTAIFILGGILAMQTILAVAIYITKCISNKKLAGKLTDLVSSAVPVCADVPPGIRRKPLPGLRRKPLPAGAIKF